MQVKVCRKCLVEKPVSEFTHKLRPSGNRTPRSWCQPCSYAYRRAFYAENPEQQAKLKQDNRDHKAQVSAYLESAKDRPCMDCGGRFPHYVLDFDHRDHETKKACVGTLRRNGASLEAVKAEVAKCDLVCANCHRIRTHKRRAGIDTYAVLL